MAFLAMSVTEDVGFGMQKLKNLCDIRLLARLRTRRRDRAVVPGR